MKNFTATILSIVPWGCWTAPSAGAIWSAGKFLSERERRLMRMGEEAGLKAGIGLRMGIKQIAGLGPDQFDGKGR